MVLTVVVNIAHPSLRDWLHTVNEEESCDKSRRVEGIGSIHVSRSRTPACASTWGCTLLDIRHVTPSRRLNQIWDDADAQATRLDGLDLGDAGEADRGDETNGCPAPHPWR